MKFQLEKETCHCHTMVKKINKLAKYFFTNFVGGLLFDIKN